MQTVYPNVNEDINRLRVELNSTYAAESNRYKLYAEWRRYWNVSKPVLIEKTPREMMMTRVLQRWFGEDRTFFIAMLRHPMASFRSVLT